MSDKTIANGRRPKIAAVSANLNPKSKTRILLQAVTDRLQHHGSEVSWIGLDQEDLPMCDGYLCYQNPRVQELTAEIQSCDAIVLASPVYNYDFNAVAKNFLELTGSAWKGKPIAFVLTAGGLGSYMAPTSFANSLWLDYHCYLYPHFLYATGHDFAGDAIESENVLTRMESLAKGFVHFTHMIRTSFSHS
jgi:NAD(P)H-dependent FMN reductase